MHLGGEGESRGEPRRSRSQSRRSRAESSRVESRPAAVSAHAPPTDASVCTLLARSLGKLTQASESAGESRSVDRGTYGYVIHWRGDRGINRIGRSILVNLMPSLFREAKKLYENNESFNYFLEGSPLSSFPRTNVCYFQRER